MAISKNRLKYLRSLQQKKYRREHGVYLLEGDKIAREIIRERAGDIVQIYATESWIETMQALPMFVSKKLSSVTARELKQISSLTTPNQVAVEARFPSYELKPEALLEGFSFYLDGLQDPGNAGTILRIADWFGFPRVFFAPGSVDPFHPKTVQAAMGALLRVEVYQHDLEALHQLAPELLVFGADMQGESVFDQEFPDSGLLVIGSEAHGIRPENRTLVKRFLSIPGRGGDGAESLNAGVAAGILAAFVTGRR